MNNAALIYAKALIHADYKKESFEDCIKMLKENPVLNDALKNPSVSNSDKYAVIQSVFTDFDQKTKNFMQLLCKNGRFSLIEEIKTAYDALYYEKEDTAVATLSYAFLPSDEEREQIEQAVLKHTNKAKVQLTLKEDPSILGGFVLQIGNVVFDNSILGSIKELKQKLKVR